jgi:hypothetical protein
MCPVDDQPLLMDAFRTFVPEAWADISPGINKALLPVFKRTGLMTRRPHRWPI